MDPIYTPWEFWKIYSEFISQVGLFHPLGIPILILLSFAIYQTTGSIEAGIITFSIPYFLFIVPAYGPISIAALGGIILGLFMVRNILFERK